MTERTWTPRITASTSVDVLRDILTEFTTKEPAGPCCRDAYDAVLALIELKERGE